MRVGATLLYKDGQCYQSYGWKMLRPLGSLQWAVNALENHHIDEITVLRPVRANDSSKRFDEDIKRLSMLKSMTPLSFGGGIRHESQILKLSSLPFERFVLSSAFIEGQESLLKALCEAFGRQAIQALLPFRVEGGKARFYLSSHSEMIPGELVSPYLLEQYANEVILYDMGNEGVQDQFNFDILKHLPIAEEKIIVSGGIGAAICARAKSLGCAAALVENRVLHQEHRSNRYLHA